MLAKIAWEIHEGSWLRGEPIDSLKDLVLVLSILSATPCHDLIAMVVNSWTVGVWHGRVHGVAYPEIHRPITDLAEARLRARSTWTKMPVKAKIE